VFEQIEFCQAHPIEIPGGYVMVRKVPVSIAKDSISVKPLDNPKIFKRWCKAVGQGGLALAGGIPVVQEIYRIYENTGGNVEALVGDPTQETGLAMLSKGMKRHYEPYIHPITRVSFWRAFGICIAQQIAVEREIRKTVINFPHSTQYVPSACIRL